MLDHGWVLSAIALSFFTSVANAESTTTRYLAEYRKADAFSKIELTSPDVKAYALAYVSGKAVPLSASNCPFRKPTRTEASLCDQEKKIIRVERCSENVTTRKQDCTKLAGPYLGRSPAI